MKSKLLIVLISAVSLIGCTSMRTVDMEQADFAEHFKTGDHLVVYEKWGRKVDMTLSEVDGNILRGSLRRFGLDTVEVNIDEVVKIEIEKISGAKTTGAVIGGIVLLPLAAVGLGLAAAAE